ncbi:D-alanine--D-alanine ligase [Neomegalonema sp.]|uniref:D-alanine--D-alanine ligase n=1 Tax=Neomegalonema sp. TaxID=2039713 RepID=UPI0026373A93|nr:D-alanine--D-alanine ligase [Neomegalonema sp.]MDD2867618.1 D-alanine--D-alanine ligase [Neomegalonema sp.]
MTQKRHRRIALLLGGRSAEREVSLASGAACAAGLRAAGYEVEEIDAGRDLAARLTASRPDAVFNALHGKWGEDGCVQGLLELLEIPYTHSGVRASALAMDKVLSKAIFRAAGLPVAESLLAAPAEIAARHLMAPPYVVKPHDEGSSVGVHVVREGANAPPQVQGAAQERLMVERYAPGRELTVAVRAGEPMTVTEIVAAGWYDYDAKYKLGGSRHVVPAEMPEAAFDAAMGIAAAAYQALGCRGVARADIRWDDSKGVEGFVLLEMNTQPGMTPTSLAPEQAAHLGISFPDFVSWMVEDASCRR